MYPALEGIDAKDGCCLGIETFDGSSILYMTHCISKRIYWYSGLSRKAVPVVYWIYRLLSTCKEEKVFQFKVCILLEQIPSLTICAQKYVVEVI